MSRIRMKSKNHVAQVSVNGQTFTANDAGEFMIPTEHVEVLQSHNLYIPPENDKGIVINTGGTGEGAPKVLTEADIDQSKFSLDPDSVLLYDGRPATDEEVPLYKGQINAGLLKAKEGDDDKPDLAAALELLDPADDSHWNSTDGKPKIDALKAIIGKAPSRADVDAAAPDFTRETAQKALDEAKAAATAEANAAAGTAA